MSAPRYTIADLCRDLAEKTEREGTEWQLTAINRLRTEDDCLCPLQYVTGHNKLAGLLDAAAEIGLAEDDVERVIEASDFAASKYPKVRAQLLAATGVA